MLKVILSPEAVAAHIRDLTRERPLHGLVEYVRGRLAANGAYVFELLQRTGAATDGHVVELAVDQSTGEPGSVIQLRSADGGVDPAALADIEGALWRVMARSGLLSRADPPTSAAEARSA